MGAITVPFLKEQLAYVSCAEINSHVSTLIIEKFILTGFVPFSILLMLPPSTKIDGIVALSFRQRKRERRKEKTTDIVLLQSLLKPSSRSTLPAPLPVLAPGLTCAEVTS